MHLQAQIYTTHKHMYTLNQNKFKNRNELLGPGDAVVADLLLSLCEDALGSISSIKKQSEKKKNNKTPNQVSTN